MAIAKPIPFESWKVVMWPWQWYDAPPANGQPIKIIGREDRGATAICLTDPGPGDWYLSVELYWRNQNHAKYRWRVVIPPA